MMAEGDRLRPLKVGVPRHHRAGVFLRLPAQHPDQPGQLRPHRMGQRPQVQPVVQRHLIVPAPPRVQALARVPNPGGQLALHKGMDILRPHIDGKRAGFQVRKDARQPVPDRLPVSGGDDPLLCEHRGVRHAAEDILPRHAGIEGNGGIEVVRFLIEFLLEPSGPQFHRLSP